MLVYFGTEDLGYVWIRQYSEAEMARYGGTLTPEIRYAGRIVRTLAETA